MSNSACIDLRIGKIWENFKNSVVKQPISTSASIGIAILIACGITELTQLNNPDVISVAANLSGFNKQCNTILGTIQGLSVGIISIKAVIDVLASIKDADTHSLGKKVFFYVLVVAAIFGVPIMLRMIADIFRGL
ncbi:MAG TPA: hypothetical protein VIK86_08145 [Candidatus Paceibacterota bacterium]